MDPTSVITMQTETPPSGPPSRPFVRLGARRVRSASHASFTLAAVAEMRDEERDNNNNDDRGRRDEDDGDDIRRTARCRGRKRLRAMDADDEGDSREVKNLLSVLPLGEHLV